MGADQPSYQNAVVVELSLGCNISCSGESCRCRNGERYCRAMNSGGKKAIPAVTYSSFYDYRSQLKRDVLRMGLCEDRSSYWCTNEGAPRYIRKASARQDLPCGRTATVTVAFVKPPKDQARSTDYLPFYDTITKSYPTTTQRMFLHIAFIIDES